MRRVLLILLLIILAAGAFWASWGFLHSPYYALYQIGKGIHDRDPGLFLTYVDLDKVLAGQKESLIEEFAPKDKSDVVSQIVTALMPQISQMAKDRVIRYIADPERDNLPSSWTLLPAANVTTNGKYALVVLSDWEEQGRRLRMGMKVDPDMGNWRVVEINSQDLKRLLNEYLEKQRQG